MGISNKKGIPVAHFHWLLCNEGNTEVVASQVRGFYRNKDMEYKILLIK